MSEYIRVRCPKCKYKFDVERQEGVFAGTEIASCPVCKIRFPAEFPRLLVENNLFDPTPLTKTEQQYATIVTMQARIDELETENRKLHDVASFVISMSNNDAYGYYTFEFGQVVYDRIKALVDKAVQE